MGLNHSFDKIDTTVFWDNNGTWTLFQPVTTGSGIDTNGTDWNHISITFNPANMTPNFYGIRAKLYGVNRISGKSEYLGEKTGAAP